MLEAVVIDGLIRWHGILYESTDDVVYSDIEIPRTFEFHAPLLLCNIV